MAAAVSMVSCVDDTTEDKYKEWRNANQAWLKTQTQMLDEKGNPFYTAVVPVWDPEAKVYVHWFNDPEKTKDNLSPLYTSTIDVKYIGRIYTGEAFDSSYVSTSPADSVRRFALNNTIEGWGAALTRMHIGDSCRILIDYPQGYGIYSMGDIIKPYSVLQFDVKLVDIYKYENF